MGIILGDMDDSMRKSIRKLQARAFMDLEEICEKVGLLQFYYYAVQYLNLAGLVYC